MVYQEYLYYGTFAIVVSCWFVFAAAFLFRKWPKSSGEKKRDSKALPGILLEAVGFACVWMFRRKTALMFEGGGEILATILSVIAIAMAVCSGWMSLSAVRALGKQWAVAARVVDDHQLVTEGVYHIVRNPIYAGMFGMMIATGLAFSEWYALAIAIIVFWIGTQIRVTVEEKLLRETFGVAFDEYARKVPSLIPWTK